MSGLTLFLIVWSLACLLMWVRAEFRASKLQRELANLKEDDDAPQS